MTTPQTWGGSKKRGAVISSILLALLGLISMAAPVQAANLYHVIKPDGGTLIIDDKNVARSTNMLVLYTTDYAPSTRTNAYGVEVIAEPDPSKKPDRYIVTKILDGANCPTGASCGNASIPAKGLVLSAHGSKRVALMNALKVGDRFELAPQYFQHVSRQLDVINPTPQTNPKGSSFPGARGPGQLVAYDSRYEKLNTSTNEFGYEATVRNGVVVAHEGADSEIPGGGTVANGNFVLSGHGSAKLWLVEAAPTGAKASINETSRMLDVVVDVDTYRYQLAQSIRDAEPNIDSVTRRWVSEKQAEIQRLIDANRLSEAVRLSVDTREEMNERMWKQMQLFPASAIKGIWHRPVEKNRTEIVQTLDYLKKAGLNTVFLETYFHGYTLFPSETMRAYGLPSQNPRFPGDLLRMWIDEAHKRGMKIHAWVETFYAGNEKIDNGGPIVAKYPHWINIQRSAMGLASTKPVPSSLETGGYFLDPANPQARSFIQAMLTELVTRYDVDGVNFDYIRYPSAFPPDRTGYLPSTWGYTAYARQLFQNLKGADPAQMTPEHPLWNDWNRFKEASITSFITEAAQQVKRVRPNVAVSADVFANMVESIARKHQRWADFPVDFLAPLTLTSAKKVIADDVRQVLAQTRGKVPVVAGLFAPFNGNTAEDMLQQVLTAKQAGANGFALFDSAHLTGRMVKALNAANSR